MFDPYFCPRVARRLRASPDADWLGSLLAALHRCGYARLTVRFYLREAELLGRWLRRHRRPLATLTDADVRRFAIRPPLRRLRCNARSAGHHLLRHLRDRGLVPPRPAPAPARIERIVAAYDAHLRDAAGLAEATRLYRRRYAREFLHAVFGTGPIRWPRLRSEHVREFVAGYRRTGRVAAAQVAAGGARSFLRWLQFRGRIGPALVAAVPLFPRWRLGVRREDLRPGPSATVRLRGKGRKDRVVPLWKVTAKLLEGWASEIPSDPGSPLFPNRFGRPMSRSGVEDRLARSVAAAARRQPTLAGKTISPHTLRHTTAMHLLQAGVDVTVIALWLGHESPETTHQYVEADVEMKRSVLGRLDEPPVKAARQPKTDGVLDFLDRL